MPLRPSLPPAPCCLLLLCTGPVAKTDLLPRASIRVTGNTLYDTPYSMPNITDARFPAAIAVMDTGVSKHPDLNVVAGVSTVDGFPDPHEDLSGHGTHGESAGGTTVSQLGGGAAAVVAAHLDMEGVGG